MASHNSITVYVRLLVRDRGGARAHCPIIATALPRSQLEPSRFSVKTTYLSSEIVLEDWDVIRMCNQLSYDPYKISSITGACCHAAIGLDAGCAFLSRACPDCWFVTSVVSTPLTNGYGSRAQCSQDTYEFHGLHYGNPLNVFILRALQTPKDEDRSETHRFLMKAQSSMMFHTNLLVRHIICSQRVGRYPANPD